MQAKIIFLGTGGDPIVVGQQMRSSAGIIIQCDENQFHIDPGPGSLNAIKENNINPRNHTAILVSHNHLNHANDTNAVITAMTHGGLDKKGVLVCSESVYKKTEDTYPFLTEFHKNCVEKSIIMGPGKKIGINDVEIHAVKANHSDKYSVGFKFFTKKFILGYTGDTSYSDELANDFSETNILIMNVKYPKGQRGSCLNTDDAIKLVEKVKPQLAIITHFGIKMLNDDPMNEARMIQRQTKIQTVSTKDGLVINPTSYSAGLKTKTLNLY